MERLVELRIIVKRITGDRKLSIERLSILTDLFLVDEEINEILNLTPKISK